MSYNRNKKKTIKERRKPMFDLNESLSLWINHVKDKMKLSESESKELKEILSQRISGLKSQGLDEEESFVIAAKRLSKEKGYHLILSEGPAWKEVAIKAKETRSETNRVKSILMVVMFSLIAGTMSKLPEWIYGSNNYSMAYGMTVFKNITLYVLPLVALYLLIQHKSSRKMILVLMGIFALTILLINVYPFSGDRNTEILTGLHTPLLMWLIVGVAYLGDEWKISKRRMDFIRFTGESFIYGVLIYSGLMVLIGFIFLIFSSINIDVSEFITKYLIVYGSYGTVLVTIYQVEKKNLMENFAPILAKIFSPLFLIAMMVFLLTIIFTGRNPLVDRNYLIAFDVMLILVLALVLYVVSSRKDDEKVGLFDYLSIGLIVTAMMIDGIALIQILVRLANLGITPNKMAALGENVLVFVNLGGLAYYYIKVIQKHVQFDILERFQTRYLTIYAGWLAIVAFIFPLLFGFK
jgi:hypothetical protein